MPYGPASNDERSRQVVATIETFTLVRDIFAAIGALGTVGGLGWRVYTWRHGRTPHVEVKISNGFPTYGPYNERLGEWSFLVTAINRGEHPVHVTSVGFLMPNGKDTLVIMHPPYPGALPATIAPRDSAQTWVERDAAEDQGLNATERPLIGWVNLSTSERFESKPAVLVAADSRKAA
jgi:hypothetical protein